MFSSVFNGMFGKIGDGMCRLSMSGGIAVKTSTGYKSYDVKNEKLTNCSNFVFDIGQEFFFCIPTNKVEIGDIILIAGKPKCVIASDDKKITVINYEDSTVETVLPERHIFMGNTYFYGKIVSMFGDKLFKDKGKGGNQIMKYMMMSELFKGGKSGADSGLSNLLPMMMLSGGVGNVFDGMFDFDIFGSTEENDGEGVDE